jgi:hypothetical protein
MSDDHANEDVLSSCTIPMNVAASARGFVDEEAARKALQKIHSVLSVISTKIDLAGLDGFTVAFDYDQALIELDRGYETSHVLTATKDVAVGVAMTPRVLRDGKVKSHIVLSAPYVLGIVAEPGEETEDFSTAMHLLAHECAHVEVTERFDRKFPGWLLQRRHVDVLENLRWQVILAAWEEYCVCRICADTGYDPTPGYAETLQLVLKETRETCIQAILSYRTEGELDEMIFNVFGNLGNLMKYSCYYTGALKGIGHTEDEYDELHRTIEDSWFAPFFRRLQVCMEELFADYGKWNGTEKFEKVGDIVEDMARQVGVFPERLSDGRVYFDVPFTAETLPA